MATIYRPTYEYATVTYTTSSGTWTSTQIVRTK